MKFRLRSQLRLRWLSTTLCFVSGFALSASAVHALIHDPLSLYAEVRSEKLALLRAWKGRVDSAAFGSSHIDNGLDPRALDKDLQGNEIAEITINLGIAGGCQIEQFVMAREFIDSLPNPSVSSEPRWVILEITASANFTAEHLVHPRAINIYDWKALRLAYDFARMEKIGFRRAAGRLSFAFSATILHYANVGMLSSEVFRPPLNLDVLSRINWEDRRGISPNEMASRGSRDYAADEEILASSHIAEPQEGEILKGHFSVLEMLSDVARKKGVRFAYVVAPRLDNIHSYPRYPAAIAGPLGMVPIFNIGQPNLHPELYQPEFWHDPSHLTEAGARRFSRLLGEELIKFSESNGGRSSM